MLHLDGTAGCHPVGEDEDIVRALDAGKIFHDGQKWKTSGKELSGLMGPLFC